MDSDKKTLKKPRRPRGAAYGLRYWRLIKHD
jgi:hypothetical protein